MRPRMAYNRGGWTRFLRNGDMISYTIYKTLHILGAFMVFLAIGGVALHGMNGGTRETHTRRGWTGAWHGVGLLLVLVAGFGMVARQGLGMAGWVYGKLVVWVLLGALLFVIARHPSRGRALWTTAAVLGLAAVYLALYKPF